MDLIRAKHRAGIDLVRGMILHKYTKSLKDINADV
jgi:hypothetical protein